MSSDIAAHRALWFLLLLALPTNSDAFSPAVPSTCSRYFSPLALRKVKVCKGPGMQRKSMVYNVTEKWEGITVDVDAKSWSENSPQQLVGGSLVQTQRSALRKKEKQSHDLSAGDLFLGLFHLAVKGIGGQLVELKRSRRRRRASAGMAEGRERGGEGRRFYRSRGGRTVRVHVSPDIMSEEVGRVEEGEIVEVEDGEEVNHWGTRWLRLRFWNEWNEWSRRWEEEEEAWVALESSGEELMEEVTFPSSFILNPQLQRSLWIVTCSSGVTVRTSPSSSATKLGIKAANELLLVTEERGGWLRLNLGGDLSSSSDEGWVSIRNPEQLSRVAEPSIRPLLSAMREEEVVEERMWQVVWPGGVGVRSIPLLQAPRVGGLRKGDVVSVLGVWRRKEEGTWLLMKPRPEEGEAWIPVRGRKGDVLVKEISAAGGATSVDEMWKVISPSGCRILADLDDNSSQMGVAPYLAQVHVVARKGAWLRLSKKSLRALVPGWEGGGGGVSGWVQSVGVDRSMVLIRMGKSLQTGGSEEGASSASESEEDRRSRRRSELEAEGRRRSEVAEGQRRIGGGSAGREESTTRVRSSIGLMRRESFPLAQTAGLWKVISPRGADLFESPSLRSNLPSSSPADKKFAGSARKVGQVEPWRVVGAEEEREGWIRVVLPRGKREEEEEEEEEEDRDRAWIKIDHEGGKKQLMKLGKVLY